MERQSTARRSNKLSLSDNDHNDIGEATNALVGRRTTTVTDISLAVIIQHLFLQIIIQHLFFVGFDSWSVPAPFGVVHNVFHRQGSLGCRHEGFEYCHCLGLLSLHDPYVCAWDCIKKEHSQLGPNRENR
jgi:hypothetical protein